MEKIVPDPPVTHPPVFLANPALSEEQALVHASELLRCAMATACECADNLSGHERHQVFSVVHLLEMTHVLLERSLR